MSDSRHQIPLSNEDHLDPFPSSPSSLLSSDHFNIDAIGISSPYDSLCLGISGSQEELTSDIVFSQHSSVSHPLSQSLILEDVYDSPPTIESPIMTAPIRSNVIPINRVDKKTSKSSPIQSPQLSPSGIITSHIPSPSSSSSSLDKLVGIFSSKISEMSTTTSNFARSKFQSINNIIYSIDTDDIKSFKPPLQSYSESLFDMYAPHLPIQSTQFEQLFYFFRNTAFETKRDMYITEQNTPNGNDIKTSNSINQSKEPILNFDTFKARFFHTTINNQILLRLIWHMFKDDDLDQIDFACFMTTWTTILQKSLKERFQLIFDALSSQHASKTIKIDSLIKKCTVVAREMASMGYHENKFGEAGKMESEIESSIFNTIQEVKKQANTSYASPSIISVHVHSPSTLSRHEFVKVAEKLSSYFTPFFGLFSFLYHQSGMEHFIQPANDKTISNIELEPPKQSFESSSTLLDIRSSEKLIAQNNLNMTYHRINRWLPQKEGFLNKQWSSVDRWSLHWVVCSNGFLWYYTDITNYSKIERAISLLNAKVEKCTTPGRWSYGFELSLPSGFKRCFGCPSLEICESWINIIRDNITDCQTKRNKSSFPVRHGQSGKFLIDGKETFENLYAALLAAKESIYISGWFISPEIYLKREPLLEESKLENVLAKKAAEGVKIFVLVWNETKIAIPTSSEYTANRLRSVIPNNLYILRHPLLHPINWSHHQKVCVVDNEIAFLGGVDLCFGRYDDCSHPIVDYDPYDESSNQTFIGKDYYNPVVAPFDQLFKPFEDLFDRSLYPRMAWHDIHVCLFGQAARDASRNFIERWNYSKESLGDLDVPYLIPKRSNPSSNSCANIEGVFHHLKIQIVRSLGYWGLYENIPQDNPEKSVYNAYLTLISRAEHFIYIENQFFVSNTAGEPVSNQIASAIHDKLREHISKDLATSNPSPSFRVIIILPVHPDGTWQNDSSIRFVMNWQYKTISRGETSLLSLLKKEFPNVDLSSYISFHCLRNHGVLHKSAPSTASPNEAPQITATLVTEQIYVHSKLMIVDDRYAIIGSANINDRSMAGDRDSEIAVVIEDQEPCQSRMQGLAYTAMKFPHQLRLKLWGEHLGLDSNADAELLMDPLSEETYQLWTHISSHNSLIYRSVFPHSPDDSIQTLDALNEDFRVHEDLDTQRSLDLIRGHLIDFPHRFLEQQVLEPEFTDFSLKVVDVEVFT